MEHLGIQRIRFTRGIDHCGWPSEVPPVRLRAAINSSGDKLPALLARPQRDTTGGEWYLNVTGMFVVVIFQKISE